MVTAIRGEYLVAPRVEPRHANRVLHRLGATIGEEHLGRIRKGMIDDEFGRSIALFIAVLGSDGAEHSSLVLYGLHHRGMLMAHVGVD